MIDPKYAIQIHNNYENFKKAFEALNSKVDNKPLTELQKALKFDRI